MQVPIIVPDRRLYDIAQIAGTDEKEIVRVGLEVLNIVKHPAHSQHIVKNEENLRGVDGKIIVTVRREARRVVVTKVSKGR